MKEQTIKMLIPYTGRDYVEGCLNGNNFRIRTGEPVDVPLGIAAILIDSQKSLAIGTCAVMDYLSLSGKRLL